MTSPTDQAREHAGEIKRAIEGARAGDVFMALMAAIEAGVREGKVIDFRVTITDRAAPKDAAADRDPKPESGAGDDDAEATILGKIVWNAVVRSTDLEAACNRAALAVRDAVRKSAAETAEVATLAEAARRVIEIDATIASGTLLEAEACGDIAERRVRSAALHDALAAYDAKVPR